MLIVDGHLDLALNAIQNGRDLLLDAYTTRALEADKSGPDRAKGTVALPEMRRGRVALCFTTICARCKVWSPTQAYGVARGQLGYYRGLEQEGHVRVITDRESLDAHVSEWKQWDEKPKESPLSTPPIGLVVSMESADPVLRPEQLEEWWLSGLRLVGPAHFGQGRFAGGTGCDAGLTEEGPALLKEMERLAIPLDLTHCSDASFWEALDHFGGRVLASHTNSRKLVPHQRGFDDDQMRAVLERGGVIGVTLGNWQLQFGWTVFADNKNLTVTLDRAIDHIDHVCQLAGDTKHVAIGSDLDGGAGTDEFPDDLDTIADLPRLEHLLADRGYSTEQIGDILHDNWIEFLRTSWSA